MSTPYERLMAEELPTGTFGGARPAQEPRTPRKDLLVTTAEEAAHHAAVLVRESRAHEQAHRGETPTPSARRHLAAVPETQQHPEESAA